MVLTMRKTECRWIPSDAFLSRIKKTYRLATSIYSQPPNTIWGDINKRRMDVHEALLASDGNDVARHLLSHPDETTLYGGADMIGYDFTYAFRDDAPFRERTALTIYSRLVGAAHSIGAIPLPYPEAPDLQYPTYDADALLDRIAATVDDAFKYPSPLAGEFGLPTKRGIISMQVPQALYQAHRLRELGKLVDGSRVLEIGPGTGRTALHARQLGCFSGYATIDLPLGIVAQACFLEATLGSDAYWLMGDDEPARAGQIRLLLAGSLDGEKFDIVLNVDSLTEMPREHAQAYFDYAMNNAKTLLSINHEVNPFRVCDLGDPQNYAVVRGLYAVRPGYAEETFFPKA